jgi:hypothetical protein
MSKSDQITKTRCLRDGDKIWLRLYSRNDKYEDAVISVECLRVLVDDGERIIQGVIQERVQSDPPRS